MFNSPFRKIIIVILLAIANRVFSQSYNFKNYNTEHGLPQSQVLSIYQDTKGYIWFGTNSGGVGKFDGNKFTTFTTNDGLTNNVVFSITGDKTGKIYFGTGKGLSVYDNFSFKNFNEKNGLKSITIYKVIEFKGQIWLGTEKGVFIYENGKISQFNSNPVLNESSVYSIFVDKDDLWFGTLQNGVILYNTSKSSFKQFSVKDGLLNNFIFSLGQMDDGTLLVGTQTGLNKISKDHKVTAADEIATNYNLSYSCIAKKEGDEFYFGTYLEGLMNFDFKAHRKKFYYGANGLTNNSILSLLNDREGNVWIGTDGAGVYKFFNKRFTYYTKSNGLPASYITAVNDDHNGNIWVALPSKGLTRIHKGMMDYYTADQRRDDQPTDNNINTILSANDGKVYFGTEDGLFLFEDEKFRTIKDTVIRHKYISSLYEDSKKNIWVGTSKGILKYSNKTLTDIREVNQFMENGMEFMIYSITEDRYGKMWFGTESGVVVLENNTAKRLNSTKDFVNTRVGSCITDKKGNIWLGTENGLYFYNNNTFTRIGKEHGVVPSFINFLQVDKLNHLIVGSNNGLDIIDLTDFYKNKVNVRHLGKDDGLLGLESNSNASAIDSSGRILIGTVNGLEIYDPKLEVFNSNEPIIHITSAKLFFGEENIMDYANGADSITSLPKDLVLPYSKNNLTFQFAGLSLIAPEKVMYQYKLIGIDKEWTPPVLKTEITYPSLPPGSYTFTVKSMNNDGVWNKEPASFVFRILSPWYNTWWFYTICVIVLVTGVISYNSYKTKKLISDKQKLEAIVDERTKELRAEKEKVEIINKEVIEQKAEIEHKNVEITDSIKYAKNIQEALLPSLIETENSFEDCFVFYQPKDIVSGDFFWFYKDGSTCYIAAADCTGHGVPGAFMSIVGNTLLNEIVSQKKIRKPGDILLELHKGVKEALNHNVGDNQRRDGMDIALCVLEEGSNKMQYAGANRPLWVYRKNRDYELEIIKATKSPIGGLELEEERIYVNHTVEVQKGDSIYIFSDGFADQFGGPKGKKLMVSNMQKLIFDNIHNPATLQKQKIKAAFESWKKDKEQVDDVLVIGIKI